MHSTSVLLPKVAFNEAGMGMGHVQKGGNLLKNSILTNIYDMPLANGVGQKYSFRQTIPIPERGHFGKSSDPDNSSDSKSIGRFVDQCFKPFSAELSGKGTFQRLSQETNNYSSQLQKLIKKRLTNLYTGLTPDLKSKIKLPEQDLKLSIMYTAQMLEELYPDHVIHRSGVTEDEFWEGQSLEYRDWQGLAAKKLSQIFSPAFLMPLEETDSCFQLKVNHMNVHRYVSMLATASFHDDLDLVVELHNPQREIDIKTPYLDILYFDPTKEQSSEEIEPSFSTTSSSTSRKKKKEVCGRRHQMPVASSKLEIPVPILHPAHVAVSVYNRENDHAPIDTEDSHIQEAIRASKEVPFIDFNELSSLGRSNTEELSTPDNLTTESLTLTSHLATQEPSISEDADEEENESSYYGGGAGAVSDFYDDSTVPCRRGLHDKGQRDDGGGDEEKEEEEEKENANAKTVYYEIEKDTSCVVDTD